MHIAVITRHAITNYGSILQSIATQKVLQNMGHSCVIIDYIRKDEEIIQLEKNALKKKPKWNRSIMKRTIYLMLRQPPSILAGIHFAAERRKYLRLTKRYSTVEGLKQDKPAADVYLSGSDQLWGPVIDGSLDCCYGLSFTGENDRRIAYASSFGVSELTGEQRSFFQKWLPRYEQITVREKQATELLREIGIESKQVLDPTLLLSGEEWRTMCATKNPQKHPYILVYQIHKNPRLERYAKKLAKAKAMPLYRITPSLNQINRGGKLIWLPNIDTFLSYLANAECLITDSFHGTAFAINLNIPFIDIITENGTESRIYSILEQFGLQERLLKDDVNLALLEKPIDFEQVNRDLEHARRYSMDILAKMLG